MSTTTKFSWNAFSDPAVLKLAAAVDCGDSRPDGAREWLQEKVGTPRAEFVRHHKDVLGDAWFRDYAGARSVVDQLQERDLGPGGRPQSPEDYLRFYHKCRNTANFRRIVLKALLRYGTGRTTDGWIPSLAILSPQAQPRESLELHQHQVEATRNLDEHLRESDKTGRFQGLLVMPTGSGKTLTAVRWLVKRILSEGGRVVWLAHRHELLEQAALTFQREVWRLQERCRVRIVSGNHCSATRIDPADHVVLCSVASLSRNLDIARELLQDPKVFLVIDEAHHAPAPTYRRLLEILEKAGRPGWFKRLLGSSQLRLLGLTATATRTDERERKVLSKLFGGKILYQVETTRLIQEGILARPFLRTVQTRADIEEIETEANRRHLERFGDLAEDLLDRIASLQHRNQVIVSEYLANRHQYGRTLVFAINIPHAESLARLLQDEGVRVGWVASRLDAATNQERLQAFRNGELDVLVNVQMMTEGVDLPQVQTVFLARPTASEILLRQMVGRALRGPRAGGTETAILVSFEDHWAQFREWMSPGALLAQACPEAEELVVPGEASEPAGEPTSEPAGEQASEPASGPSYEEILRRLVEAPPPLESEAERFDAVPLGWYELEDGEAPVLVYKHHKPFWEELERDRIHRPEEANFRFVDCDDPLPPERDVERVVRHLAVGGTLVLREFAERHLADPVALAQQVVDGDLGERERVHLLEERYQGLAREAFPTLWSFRRAVDDELFRLRHPDLAPQVRHSSPVFEHLPDRKFASGPCHDLPRLWTRMLREGAPLLGLPGPPRYDGELLWTNRIVKGWFGYADFGRRPARVRINRLLDSPDVKESVIVFLMWHEFLHVYLNCGHTPEFRRLEHLWPNRVKEDWFLDTLGERFSVEYW